MIFNAENIQQVFFSFTSVGSPRDQGIIRVVVVVVVATFFFHSHFLEDFKSK